LDIPRSQASISAIAPSTGPSGSGKLLPLLSARWIIPAQAFALKQYFGGTLWVSKASDKEETAAPLGHSEELRIEYSPCQTVPEFIHRSQDASEILPFAA